MSFINVVIYFWSLVTILCNKALKNPLPLIWDCDVIFAHLGTPPKASSYFLAMIHSKNKTFEKNVTIFFKIDQKTNHLFIDQICCCCCCWKQFCFQMSTTSWHLGSNLLCFHFFAISRTKTQGFRTGFPRNTRVLPVMTF